jgi:hypothetical protein
MSNSRPISSRVFLVILLLTYAMTVARLVLELSGTGPAASRGAGGGGFWLGISWLPPLVGALFAMRLCAAGSGPRRPLRVVAFSIAALAIAIGLAVFNFQRAKAGEQTLMVTFLIGGALWLAIAAVLARSWPALAKPLFVYGLLARLGVVVVTVICVAEGWDTHYTRFGASELPYVPASDQETILLATVPQLGLWIGITVIAGMLGGGIVAVVKRPRG